MIMKKECEIVRDLFPNYVEKQISDVTKEFVEKHVKECKPCAYILESLARRK